MHDLLWDASNTGLHIPQPIPSGGKLRRIRRHIQSLHLRLNCSMICAGYITPADRNVLTVATSVRRMQDSRVRFVAIRHDRPDVLRERMQPLGEHDADSNDDASCMRSWSG